MQEKYPIVYSYIERPIYINVIALIITIVFNILIFKLNVLSEGFRFLFTSLSLIYSIYLISSAGSGERIIITKDAKLIYQDIYLYKVNKELTVDILDIDKLEFVDTSKLNKQWTSGRHHYNNLYVFFSGDKILLILEDDIIKRFKGLLREIKRINPDIKRIKVRCNSAKQLYDKYHK